MTRQFAYGEGRPFGDFLWLGDGVSGLTSDLTSSFV